MKIYLMGEFSVSDIILELISPGPLMQKLLGESELSLYEYIYEYF